MAYRRLQGLLYYSFHYTKKGDQVQRYFKNSPKIIHTIQLSIDVNHRAKASVHVIKYHVALPFYYFLFLLILMEKEHVSGCWHRHTKVRGTFNLVDKKEHIHEKYAIAYFPHWLNDTEKRPRTPENSKSASSLLLFLTVQRKTLHICVEKSNLDLA